MAEEKSRLDLTITADKPKSQSEGLYLDKISTTLFEDIDALKAFHDSLTPAGVEPALFSDGMRLLFNTLFKTHFRITSHEGRDSGWYKKRIQPRTHVFYCKFEGDNLVLKFIRRANPHCDQRIIQREKYKLGAKIQNRESIEFPIFSGKNCSIIPIWFDEEAGQKDVATKIYNSLKPFMVGTSCYYKVTFPLARIENALKEINEAIKVNPTYADDNEHLANINLKKQVVKSLINFARVLWSEVEDTHKEAREIVQEGQKCRAESEAQLPSQILLYDYDDQVSEGKHKAEGEIVQLEKKRKKESDMPVPSYAGQLGTKLKAIQTELARPAAAAPTAAPTLNAVDFPMLPLSRRIKDQGTPLKSSLTSNVVVKDPKDVTTAFAEDLSLNLGCKVKVVKSLKFKRH